MSERKYQLSKKYADGTILVVWADAYVELLSDLVDVASIEAAMGVASVQQGGNTGTETLEVDTIELASGGDHPRWVVKGEWAQKYGITCWPETLEAAGLDPDPTGVTELKGWVAEYISKPKQDGDGTNPDKVTKLIAPGNTANEDLEELGYQTKDTIVEGDKFPRPLSPENLKKGILTRANAFVGKESSDKHRKFVASMLTTMLGDDKKRYAFTEWLTGVTSMTDVAPELVHAMGKWIDADENYKPNKMATVEANAGYDQALREQGQSEFPM